tara:strand:- start:7073 stop:7762 length:690 start_codon:yes stop_codon:yes gene_type:complete
MDLKDDLKRWGLLRRVKRELLLDKCLDKVDMPDDETKKSIINQWLQQNKIKNQAELDTWIQKHEMNIEDWESFAVRSWQWSEYCLAAFAGELNSHYLKRKSSLDKVTYSLLRTESKDLADELYLRIKDSEETFSKLSSEYSDGPEKKTQGWVGPVSIGQTHPALAKLLISSTDKQLWSPRKLEKWWVIVRLEKLECTQLDENTKRILACELGDLSIDRDIDSFQLVGDN